MGKGIEREEDYSNGTELGEVVVVAFEDGKGTGPSLVRALDSSSSSMKRVVAPLNLPQSGGLVDGVFSGDIVSFIDDNGNTKLSLILILQDVASAYCANVAQSVFEYIMASSPIQSPSFTVIIAAATFLPGYLRSHLDFPEKFLLATFLNGASDRSFGVFAKFPRIPPQIRIQEDFLACLIHTCHVMALPTILLLGPKSQGQVKDETSQVVSALGMALSQQFGVSFSVQVAKDMQIHPASKSSGPSVDEWRALYT